jgi:hypothetical protein
MLLVSDLFVLLIPREVGLMVEVLSVFMHIFVHNEGAYVRYGSRYILLGDPSLLPLVLLIHYLPIADLEFL